MKFWKMYLAFYLIGGCFTNGAIYETMEKECGTERLMCGRAEAFIATIFWPTYWSQEAWKSYRSKAQKTE
jgi:hypothetical protein